MMASVEVKSAGRSMALPTQRRQIHRGYAAMAVLLLVVSALLGAALFAAEDDQVSVWVAARDLEAGHTVSRRDLRVVEFPATTAVSAVSTSSAVEGRVVRVPVGSGAVLTAAQLLAVGDTFERSGMAEVGLRLGPSQVPLGLEVGDVVTLVEVLGDNDVAGFGTVAGVSVVALERSDSSSGPITATVAVRADVATAVATAASAEDVVVIVTGRN